MITFVSALYPDLFPGQGDARLRAFAQSLRHSGLPLVLYADPGCEDALRQSRGVGEWVPRLLEPDRFEAGLWRHEQLQARQPEAPAARLARCMHLRALGLLHDESLHNPFGSEYFVWLDPCLLETLHPAYLELAPRMAGLLERFLLLRPPADAPPSMALFGGPRGALGAINQTYWEHYAQAIDAGQPAQADALLGQVLAQQPESFHLFELQSNGLVGHFFEGLRQGRLRLERACPAGAPSHG